MFKSLFAALLALSITSAYAETPQQEKMKACNDDATKKELKGDERKAFMSECLSAKKEQSGEKKEELTAQQQKMKQCNQDAKGMKGKERKEFMSKCLKG